VTLKFVRFTHNGQEVRRPQTKEARGCGKTFWPVAIWPFACPWLDKKETASRRLVGLGTPSSAVPDLLFHLAQLLAVLAVWVTAVHRT